MISFCAKLVVRHVVESDCRGGATHRRWEWNGTRFKSGQWWARQNYRCRPGNLRVKSRNDIIQNCSLYSCSYIIWIRFCSLYLLCVSHCLTRQSIISCSWARSVCVCQRSYSSHLWSERSRWAWWRQCSLYWNSEQLLTPEIIYQCIYTWADECVSAKHF